MSDLPALLTNSPESDIALSDDFLDTLKTPQDYENAFTLVSQQKNTRIWWEADLILSYYKKFLGKHLDVYRAGQLMNNSTVKYYLRTASGFPPETRIPSISFNHHYQASFADEWDSKTLQFGGDKRFLFAEKATDDQMSVRKLREVLDDEKEKMAKKVEEIPCESCQNKEGYTSPALKYTIYTSGKRKDPVVLHLHEQCFDEMLDHIHG